MPTTGSSGKGNGRRRAGDYRLADTRLDGTLDEWPSEPPRAPRAGVTELVGRPGPLGNRLPW
jgi:hypothetical protein